KMQSHYQTLLEGIVTNPEQRLGELPLLTASEKHQLLVEWNNTQMYLLDGQLQPVPVGIPGELYIGGDGLARGYFNQPDLTAKTFIPHPFSSQLRARLYKTGDLARYLPDGNIEFLGRIDQQVKIRGFRIQLADIETALTQHPKVQQAVVTINTNQSGDKYLVAYVVPEEQASKEKTCTLKSTALRIFTTKNYQSTWYLRPL
ncbi:MAG: AMP-binding protein, partial [Scytonema sp. CRU_2_7]|nr:AMP-binding protein [Scytonema sp. CRU_2_7]